MARGMFSYLIDKAAFIDRIDLNVSVRKPYAAQPPDTDFLRTRKLQPIGSKGSQYGRLARGRYRGLDVEVKYSKRPTYRRIPDARVTVHSERHVVTWSKVELLLDRLGYIPAWYTVEVSWLELTFDMTKASIADLLGWLFTRARVRVCKGETSSTVYAGSRKSPWEVRMYEKSKGVVRLEFILRRAFLRKRNLLTGPRIARLSSVRLFDQLVTFLRVKGDIGDDQFGYRIRAIHSMKAADVELVKKSRGIAREPELVRVDGCSLPNLRDAVRKSGSKMGELVDGMTLQTQLMEMQENMVW